MDIDKPGNEIARRRSFASLPHAEGLVHAASLPFPVFEASV